jgi:signal transduction histidine kinase
LRSPLQIEVIPAFYQTRWFAALVSIGVISLIAIAYMLRLRQITAKIRLVTEGRANERVKIARDLHDTLLQSFQGLLLRFQTVSNHLLPTRPAEAKQTLDGAIDLAAQPITEGRDAVQGLRSSTVETNDLVLNLFDLVLNLFDNVPFRPHRKAKFLLRG